MKKQLWITILICIFILSEGNFLSADNASITRDISNFSQLNQEFEVVLELIAQGEIAGLGIQESFPSGASVSNCSENNSRIINNILEIIVFDPDENVTSRNITYNITLTNGGTFSGIWNTTVPNLNGSIALDLIQICGDTLCNGDESCSTCATDCGVCPSTGGGSSGGGSSPKVISNTTNQTIQEQEIPPILDESPETSEAEPTQESGETSQGFFRLAGGAVTDVLSNKEGKLSIIRVLGLVIIIAGIVIGIHRVRTRFKRF
ncbi:MAG: hypothetical protein ABIB79_00880 [archaeon]